MASPLLAYSFLRANYGADVKSPVDIVFPLVRRAFFRFGKPYFDNSEIQEKIRKTWGIEIPINVIRYSYSRLQRSGLISYEEDNGRFRINNIQYFDEIVKEKEETARRDYGFLRQCIDRVLIDESYGETFSGELVLEEWLDHSSLGFLGANPAFAAGGADHDFNRIVALASQHPVTGSEFLSKLSEVAIGDAIYRAVKATTEYESADLDIDLKRRMDGVSVYLDTKLLFRLLGYSGPEHERAAQELINLCRQTGCSLKVFEHTTVEMQNIFVTVANKLMYSSEVAGDLASYAVTAGLAPGDLIDRSTYLAGALAEFGISVEPALPYTNELGIDERDLDNRLRVDLRQENDNARIADVASLAAVYRLRNGRGMEYLESCNAVFVTSNKGLMDSAGGYFRDLFKDLGIPNRVQICMTDVVLSSRLWTKLPTASDALPRDQILSHVLGNLRPNPEVLNSFFQNLDQLQNENRVDAEAAAAVRISRFTAVTLAQEFQYSKTQLSQKESITVLGKILEKGRKARADVLESVKREAIEAFLAETEQLSRERQLAAVPVADIDPELENKVQQLNSMRADLLRI